MECLTFTGLSGSPRSPWGNLDSCAGNQSPQPHCPQPASLSQNPPAVSAFTEPTLHSSALWYTPFPSLVFPWPRKLLHLLNDPDQMSPGPYKYNSCLYFSPIKQGGPMPRIGCVLYDANGAICIDHGGRVWWLLYENCNNITLWLQT